jgi:hypothetical protein
MADTKTVLDIKIEAAQAASTIRNISKALKGLKEEQANATDPKDWNRLAKAINETEGKLGDINDSFKTLTGSGVERLNSSVGLMREGFASFDFGKIGASLKGLGAAFRAIPIFLIVEGITKLIENFDELKNSGGLLGKIFTAIGDAIDAVGDAINYVTDAIGLTNTALDKQGEALKTNAEKSKGLLESVNAEYDRQIKLINASGESTVEVEKKKQEAIIATNKELLKQTIAYINAGGKLTEEQLKVFGSQVEAVKNAQTEIKALEIKDDKDREKKNTERAEKNKKAEEDRLKNLEANQTRLADMEYEIWKENKERQEKEEEEIAKRNLERKNKEFADAQAIKKYWDDLAKAENDKIEKEVLEQAQNREAGLQQIKADSLAATAALSTLYFQIELNKAKGNSARELEIRKRQFIVEKAFKVAQITMDGIQGAIKAYALNPLPSPIGIISASLQGIAAAAAVAKVLTTKFEGGAPSSGGGLEISQGGVGQVQQPINTQAPTTQANTTFDAQGNVMNQKIVVSVEEINQKQGRVARLEEQATI